MATYLIDTTVLIDWLRGRRDVETKLLGLVAAGHVLGITCVNLAEVERGLLPKERRRAGSVLNRLRFLATDREAARRAGRYQATWSGRGRTIHTPDALIAGTARVHGAVLLTHNIDDFPMRDVRVERQDDA